MSPNLPNPQLTDADLDAALRPDQDTLLPASGFADSVMSAIHREAAAPAPIPFPWRRAFPGLAIAVLVLFGVLAAVVLFLRSTATMAPAPNAAANPQAELGSFLHSAASLNLLSPALWLLFSFAVALACLLFCRRLITAR